MFPFNKKRRTACGSVAFGFYSDGVAMARVTRQPNEAPVLDACEYTSMPGAGGWGAAVEELTERFSLDRNQSSIVIEDGSYALLLVDAPEVPVDELKAAVRWRIRESIDFHIDDAVIDVFDIPEQRSGGGSRMMYVVAARAALLREKTAIAQASNLTLGIVDIPELAQRNVAARLPEDADGVAVLKLSERSGLITLTRQGTLYLTRRLDSGLSAVAGETGITTRVQHWLDTLAVEIQRSLDYYESNFSQPPISALVYGPMEHPVAGMESYIAEQLGVSVRSLDLNSVVAVQTALSPTLQARCFPAIGAALRHEQVSL